MVKSSQKLSWEASAVACALERKDPGISRAAATALRLLSGFLVDGAPTPTQQKKLRFQSYEYLIRGLAIALAGPPGSRSNHPPALGVEREFWLFRRCKETTYHDILKTKRLPCCLRARPP